MKKISYLLILVSVLLLFGCSCKSKNANVEEGMSYIESGDYASAVKSFEKDISSESNLEMAYRGEGIAYLKDGNHQSAILALQEALNQAKGKVGDVEIDICYYLAEAQYSSGDYESAIETCSNLIKYDEENTDAYYFRGILYLNYGDTQSAIQDFDNAVSFSQKNYQLNIRIYEALKDSNSTQAEGYLDRAEEILLSKTSDTADFHCNLGKINYYKGNIKEAKEELEKAVKSDSTEALLYQGIIYKDEGDTASAITALEEYLLKDTSNSKVYNTLGLCEMQMDAYEKAVESFQSGLNAATGNMWKELKRNIIIAYESCGDFENAKIQMTEYIKKYPEDENAQKENEFLQTR